MINTILTILNPQIMFFMTISVAGGLVVGAIPGLSATMAMALLTPLTYAMAPTIAFPILCSVYIGSVSGGFFSAILLKIPGTSSSIATTFDGYPMAKKGQSGQAIGLSLIGSFIGGTVSFVLLSTIAPLLAKVALKFGPAEYFALALLGLSTIAAVVGNSIGKGLLSALLGLALGTVGLDVIMGMPRFTLGRLELLSGFDVIVVMIGVFAIPQIIRDIINPSSIKVTASAKFKDMLPSLSYLKSQIINFIRSSLIGTWIGLLPGAGGSIASLLSYDQAKKASKYPEEFGKGCPDGLVASETANNAVIGGSLIPMLTLGIPGDTPAAVLLAAFTLHGLQAGPLLFTQNLDIVHLVLGSLFISNILMILVASIGAKYIIKTLEVKRGYLAPAIVVMCIIGSYAANQRPFDIIIMLGLGVLGFFFEYVSIPMSPLVLGVILGPLIEKNLRRSIQVSNTGFIGIITRPLTAIILLLVLFNFLKPLISMVIKKNKEKKTIQKTVNKDNVLKVDIQSEFIRKQKNVTNRLLGVGFVVLGVIYFIAANRLKGTVMGDGGVYGPGFYPKLLAIGISFFGIVIMFEKPKSIDNTGHFTFNINKLILTVAILIIYPISMYVVGFLISSLLFLSLSVIYLEHLKTKREILKALVFTFVFVAIIYFVFERLFMIVLPSGMLF